MTADAWLERLDGPGYWWDRRQPPATDSDIAVLTAFAGRPLPADYITFLRRSDGGALWYKDLWYLRLWCAADLPSWSAAYGLTPSEIPGALAFGDDGGSEAVVFDLRPERADGDYPVYLINFVSINWREAIQVAPDFRSLLLLRTNLFGREEA